MHVQDKQGNPVDYCVQLCPNGCVCLAFGVTSIHLTPEDFAGVLAAMSRAAAALGIQPGVNLPSPPSSRPPH